ncbi:YozE SAM-like protein [Arcticibacter tournemirensis]|uniref:Uncharacterized protein n=1 Tax=Arcticibacter tournemirensis TaxID=699437 RepID=A0A5M9HG83_9SPHI|nr:YozE family protein [Arcticibacter tournemirensis]KAA8485553.1 hypothetical protein F1649_03470 [Arcticibacter tournemirensis]TQM48733.1 YozE SAM-like protein [Arcticibacter tournemirensis]
MNNKKPTLAFIKRQAKNLKRKNSITHTQALEIIAKDFGFSNWKHCQRSLNEQPAAEIPPIKEQIEVSFTDWLKKHQNRDTPLGDLAKDMLGDRSWPLYDTLEAYRSYLSSHRASIPAMQTLERVWKSYKAFLRRAKVPRPNIPAVRKPVVKNHDLRKIVSIKGVIPRHYNVRTVEKFEVGDKAWISWGGKKAIPVTIVDVDLRHYSVRTERPLTKAGSVHSLFLDEVRSTPELACINHVTL